MIFELQTMIQLTPGKLANVGPGIVFYSLLILPNPIGAMLAKKDLRILLTTVLGLP